MGEYAMLGTRALRLYYVLVAAWSITSLLLAPQVSTALALGTPEFVAVLLILAVSPVLPVLWLWLSEKSPWCWPFLLSVILVGLIATVAFESGRYASGITYIPLAWSSVSCLAARLLKPASRISAISWSGAHSSAPPPPPTAVDHRRYLLFLDDEVATGFPSVERVRAALIHGLPEAVPSLVDHGPIPGQTELSSHTSFMRQFMIRRISTELAFLCAFALFERIFGPDFRCTKQYQSLVDFVLSVDATMDGSPRAGNFDDLAKKAVTLEDIRELVAIADGRKDVSTNTAREGGSDDVNVAVAALVVLSKSGLLLRGGDKMMSSEVARMMKRGMNVMREGFFRRNATLVG